MLRYLPLALLLVVGCAEGAARSDGGTDAPGQDAGDGGQDDGGTDVQVDMGPIPCRSNSECDDGNPCNGAETCGGDGTCEAGTPIMCDDSVACTLDSCNTETGECVSTPDDGQCAGDLSCTENGCEDLSCSETPCRLLSPQCGCPAGRGCALDSDNMRVCVPAGPAVSGEACSSGNLCSPGNDCITVGGSGGPSHCRQYCNSNSDCTGAGSICFLEIEGLSSNFCTVTCEPTDATDCTGGACLVLRDMSNRTFTACTRGGAGTQGSVCNDTSRCSHGFGCYTFGGSDQCLRYCTISPPGNQCGSLRCIPFQDPHVVGGVEWGVCVP